MFYPNTNNNDTTSSTNFITVLRDATDTGTYIGIYTPVDKKESKKHQLTFFGGDPPTEQVHRKYISKIKNIILQTTPFRYLRRKHKRDAWTGFNFHT